MLAIASLLDAATEQQTRDLWRILEEKCGLSGIMAAPYPHFSWLSCEELAWTPVKSKLKRLSNKVKRFKVRTAGLGIFSGEKPILYLSLVKTRQLMVIHELIWKKVGPHLVNPQDYYRPELWMPHISIAHGDLNAENLACAVRDLAFEPVTFEVEVNNISVIYNKPDGVGVKASFDLE